MFISLSKQTLKLLTVNCFRKKALSQVSGRILNTPLNNLVHQKNAGNANAISKVNNKKNKLVS